MIRATRAWHANNHWHLELAVAHVVQLRAEIHDLIHREQREVREHDLDHRSHALDGCADGETDDRVLRDRSVENAGGTEPVAQSERGREDPTELANFLAHHD